MPNADAAEASRPHRVVILDNYDSYVFNLYQAVGEIVGIESWVVRSDRVDVSSIANYDPTHIIISPGPGNPALPKWFGVCRSVISALGPSTPTLGVCLGHQGIGVAYGGNVVRAEPVHGKTCVVRLLSSPLFSNLPREIEVMRYHSLVVEPATLPSTLRVTAWAGDLIMALEHTVHPVFGVQFHPESIGTPAGPAILANFLALRPQG